MRMRKKPWARPELEACKFFIQNPSEYKGRWKEFFGNDKPIYMELGCGKGTFMAVHGSENPDKNYITIDIKDEVLVLAKRNIEAAYEKKGQEIDNVALMSQEIAIIDNMLGDGDEISRIYINFCNPWPKDRHKKRRLTHTRQIEKYKKFLKDGSEIWFKTDDDELFDESLEYFKDVIWKQNLSQGIYIISGFEGNVVTEHERMFTEQGIKTKFIILQYNK